MIVMHDRSIRTDRPIGSPGTDGGDAQPSEYRIEFNNQPMKDRTSAGNWTSPRLCSSAAIQ